MAKIRNHRLNNKRWILALVSLTLLLAMIGIMAACVLAASDNIKEVTRNSAFVISDKEDRYVLDNKVRREFIPKGYALAKDQDFVRRDDGNFTYVGSLKKIVIPWSIHGRQVTSYDGMFIDSEVEAIASNNSRIRSTERTFYNFKGASLDLTYFETKSVENMSSMFADSRLVNLTLGEGFQTNMVEDMSYMFMSYAGGDLDLLGFDTNRVKTMRAMFSGAQLQELDLSSFDTSQVTDMNSMFSTAQIVDLDISNFRTDSVQDMSYMFAAFRGMDLDLTNFRTTSLTRMTSMFYGYYGNKLDLSSFDLAAVNALADVFATSNIGQVQVKSQADRSKLAAVSQGISFQIKDYDPVIKRTLRDRQVSHAIATAEDVARINKGKAVIKIPIEVYPDTRSVELTIPRLSLEEIAKSKVTDLALVSDLGTINMDFRTMSELAKEARGKELVLTLTKLDYKDLPSAIQDVLVRKKSPLYEITIVSDKINLGKTAKSNHEFRMTFPYKLALKESTKGLKAYHISPAGKIEKFYLNHDDKANQVTFTANHLSIFALVNEDLAADAALPFVDVAEDSWYYEDVAFVYDRELFKGISASEFGPDQAMTRAMFTTVLFRLAGEPAYRGDNQFVDVADDMYYTIPINWAASQGIVQGYGEGRFGPYDMVNREQMALILMNYGKQEKLDFSYDHDISYYRDANLVSVWAVKAMEWADAHDLLRLSNNRLEPQKAASRAELAKALQAYVKLGSSR